MASPIESDKQPGSYNSYGYDRNESDRERSIFWYYLDLLIRRIWVITTVVVIVLTIGVVKAFRTPPVYKATARILLEKQSPRLMNFQGMGQEYSAWDPDFYNTMAGVAKSRAVMEIALKNPEIKRIFESPDVLPVESTGSFLAEIMQTLRASMGVAPMRPAEPWELLRSRIKTEAVKNTHFVAVTVEDVIPEYTELMANAAASAFEQFSLKEKTDMLGESFGFLQKEKEKEEQALAASEQALKEFMEKAKGLTLGDAGVAAHPSVQRMNELNAELGKVHLEVIEIRAEIESMRSISLASKEDIKASSERLFSIPVVRQDPSLMALRGRLAEAEKELSVLSSTYGLEHPLFRAAETNIVLIRAQFMEGFSQAVMSREKKVNMLSQKETEIQRQYEEEKKIAVGLTGEANVYVRLKSEVDRHRHLYESIVSRLLEIDISSGLVQSNVKVVDRAKIPSSPDGPDRLRIIGISLFIGLLLGSGLAFVFENLDQTVKTPEDLKERLGLPLLGFIPAIFEDEKTAKKGASAGVKGKLGVKTSISLLARRFLAEFFHGVIPAVEESRTAHEPLENAMHRGAMVAAFSTSSIAEAYRHIRTNLFFSTPANAVKILVVTSSRPGEGKTTTCTNLATVIAQSGKRVLLVDADLHRPMVRKIFALSSRVGLTDVLVGQVKWRDALQVPFVNDAAVPNLQIMCSGTRSPNPSELVGSAAMREFLSEARQVYDWVILDTPPVLFVSDASILGALSDGVVLVVKSGISARSLLARTKDQLDTVKAKIIGTILNNMRVSRIGRHYSYYYYHGYSRYARDYHKSYYGSEHAHDDEKSESREVDA